MLPFSDSYLDYSGGSTPFGEIADLPRAAYNRANSGSGFSVRFRVEDQEGEACLKLFSWTILLKGSVKGTTPGYAKATTNRNADGLYGNRDLLFS